MVLDFQEAAQRRTRRLLVTLTVLVLLLAGTVLALMFRSGDGDRSGSVPAAAPTAGTASPGASTAGPAQATPEETLIPEPSFVSPARWVSLPRPTGKRAGFPSGWSHTPQGAVAAAIAYVTASSSWDFATADRATRAYSAAEDLTTSLQAAKANVAASRAHVGLPASGPLPSGARLVVNVVGVQWTALDADTVQPALLSRVTYSSGAAPEQTQIVSATLRMAWRDGDWRGVISPKESPPPAADLGSQAFNIGGWTAIQQGSSG